MIRESVAKQIGAHITKSSQLVLQADGQSPIAITRETRLVVTRDNNEFILEALVAQNVEADVLAGVPFMNTNDTAVRPAKRQIILGDGTTYEYGIAISTSSAHAIHHTQARVPCAPPKSTTIWPWELIELDCKDPPNCELPLEPRTDCAVNSLGQQNNAWPLPRIVSSVAGKISIPNDTDSPLILQLNQHFAQVCPTFYPDSSPSQSETLPSILNITRPSPKDHSAGISLDPDSILSHSSHAKFLTIYREFDQVFNSNFTGYNSAEGPLQGDVNMGPTLLPQHKGCLPQYALDRLAELQEKFDRLENVGVFKRPEDLGIVAEYVNPSFLVQKPSGTPG